jgi:transcriptional regulator with XRE-family HTH domain
MREKKREGTVMIIGARLRDLREEKGLSQGDVEKSTGLLRCYISRIENGHTIPSLDTLERFSQALDVPLYKMFYTGEGDAPTPNLLRRKSLNELAEQPGEAGEDARFMLQFKNTLAQLGEPDRDVVLTLAKKLASR